MVHLEYQETQLLQVILLEEASGTFASTLTVNTANSNILTLNRTTSAGGYMRFQNNGTDKFYIGSRATISGSGGTGYDIYAVGGNDIRFFPGTLLALTLDTSANATFAGDVTISKAATPLFKLLDTTYNVSLLLGADDANTFIRSSSSAKFIFTTWRKHCFNSFIRRKRRNWDNFA